MKQSFIKIGEGLTDLFEFTTLIEYNHKRINRMCISIHLILRNNYRPLQ